MQISYILKQVQWNKSVTGGQYCMIPFRCSECSCDHEDSIAFVHRCQRRKSYCLTKKRFCFANGKGSLDFVQQSKRNQILSFIYENDHLYAVYMLTDTNFQNPMQKNFWKCSSEPAWKGVLWKAAVTVQAPGYGLFRSDWKRCSTRLHFSIYCHIQSLVRYQVILDFGSFTCSTKSISQSKRKAWWEEIPLREERFDEQERLQKLVGSEWWQDND